MPIHMPRPEWAMSGLQAERYEVAIDILERDYGMSREQAQAALEGWDQEAARRGLERESPDYFKDVYRWLPPPSPKGSG